MLFMSVRGFCAHGFRSGYVVQGISMDLLSLVTDNVTELLVKVIEFTEGRQKLLIRNIRGVDKPGYAPRDLPVDEFCGLMNVAIGEHAVNHRLLMQDTDHIKFDASGGFEARAVIDDDALSLLAEDRDGYIKLQTERLLENSLHQRMAAELLRSTEGVIA